MTYFQLILLIRYKYLYNPVSKLIIFYLNILTFLFYLDYSRTDMRGAAGEAVDNIYREPVATKQIGSPLG